MWALNSSRVAQEGSHTIVAVGDEQGLFGQAGQEAFGQRHFALTLGSNLGCQRIMHANFHQDECADFGKADFIRRDAALLSEARICGVLITENCVPSMATSRLPR